MSRVAHLESRDLARRVGVKGPRAAAWLQQQGVTLPETPNSWCPLESDGLVMRLGASEFFLEESLAGSKLAALEEQLQTPLAGVYPVLHQDRAFTLTGNAASDVLAQLCNVNFASLSEEARIVVMTLMIGVSAIVVPQGNGARRCYRIWCDPSFGDYVWSSLEQGVDELDSDRESDNGQGRTQGGQRSGQGVSAQA